MDPPGAFQTTAIGSFPHTEGGELSHRLVTSLDIPCWPQLPRRSFRERMYVQKELHFIQNDDGHTRLVTDGSSSGTKLGALQLLV